LNTIPPSFGLKSEVEEIAMFVKSNPLPHQIEYTFPVINGSDHVRGFYIFGYGPEVGKYEEI
jgi:hypothetical protein